ncbi:hypothetical protein Tco_0887398 [Tanacetum coccineum]
MVTTISHSVNYLPLGIFDAMHERGLIGDVGVGEDADEFSEGVRAAEEDNSRTTQFELVFTFMKGRPVQRKSLEHKDLKSTLKTLGLGMHAQIVMQ